MQRKLERAGWLKNLPDAAERAAIKDRIWREGPLSTKAFESAATGPKEMWSRPPHKRALDYMWYGGELATCHRVNFTKYYDLAERVFPADLRNAGLAEDAQVDWLCHAALDRMGFATTGEIQKFWDAVDLNEAKGWVAGNRDLVPVEIESKDGHWISAVAVPDIETRLASAPAPTQRLRILNPFDPAIRDRQRLARLFGFDYRIEMFVPEAKRIWGYYVFPLLEGDRFVGRIDAKADRKAGTLTVRQVWKEPRVQWTEKRQDKLLAELSRLARFVGVTDVVLP